ncbi:MAG: TatD family hydrolase [Clostridiaceae bacterium]
MYIDAHNHLDFYGENLNKALTVINENNIKTLACSMDEESYLFARKLSEKNSLIIPAFGVHPWRAHENYNKLESFEEYIKETSIIGEVGLDFHWVLEKERYPLQLKILKYFLEGAKKYNKVTNLHTKGAEGEILDLIRRYDLRTPIIHWYSGSLEVLKKLLDMGCYFTISVDVSYSKLTDDIVKYLPIERILTETDGPTALEWVNGEYAYPSYIKNIIKEISAIKRLSEEEIKETIYNNFRKLTEI